MIEIKGNLWDTFDHEHVTCITTNGTLKRNGEGVMGRGCALEATKRFPGLSRRLGRHVDTIGNHVGHLLDKPHPILLAFPVKHEWWERADLKLIERSCQELLRFMHAYNKICVLPRPGCGNGRLSWSQVGPLLHKILEPSYFRVISP